MNKHFLCPKPKRKNRAPFIPAVSEIELPWFLGRLIPTERKALAAIVKHADLTLVEDTLHLMIEATPDLIDALAAYQAEGEDREFILEDEKDEGEEDDSDSDAPADRDAMMEERGEPDYDDEELSNENWLECDGYRALLMIQRERKLWRGEPVS